MSVEICSQCQKPVDTDFNTLGEYEEEVIVDGIGNPIATKNVYVCEGCIEKRLDNIIDKL